MTETRIFRGHVQFPCVCGKICVAGSVRLESGSTEPAVTHPEPACALYVELEIDEFMSVCRKKLEEALAGKPS